MMNWMGVGGEALVVPGGVEWQESEAEFLRAEEASGRNSGLEFAARKARMEHYQDSS